MCSCSTSCVEIHKERQETEDRIFWYVLSQLVFHAYHTEIQQDVSAPRPLHGELISFPPHQNSSAAHESRLEDGLRS